MHIKIYVLIQTEMHLKNDVRIPTRAKEPSGSDSSVRI